MKEEHQKIQQSLILRKKAEALLKKQQSEENIQISDAEAIKLYHELSVHQIELEIQNKELIDAKESLEVALNKYSELYDFAPTGYITLTKDGQIIHLNLCAAQMLGNDRQHLTNNMFGFFVSINSKQLFFHFLTEVFKSQTKQSCEVNLSGNGKPEMSLNLIGQVTKNGSTCDISMIDITERKQAEAKLADILNKLTISNQELEHSLQLNSDKDLFISILAHDLRNPFSVILGYTELLQKNIRKFNIKEIENHVNEINKSTHSTIVLLEDLLRWSRVRIGKFPFEPKKLKFTDLCNEIFTLLTPIAETKNITIECHADDKIRITADADMIKAVFRNLVSNAIKFTKRKGRIIISAEQTKSDIIFSVSDTGIGITPENLTKLFEYSQYRTTTGTDNEKGSGFGLLICKDFIEKHGGKIWVESDYGKGSVFYFNIPRRFAKKEPATEIKKVNKFKNLKILIAEDNEALRIILGDMVEDYSREVLYAETGHEAVSIYVKNPDIDLILMDFYMPGLNGYEATKQIRLLNKEVIIILETADELSEVNKESMRESIDDYFFKPYNRTFLDQLILKYFGTKKQ